MNLNVLGDLALEKDGILHQKPYIALLALCYIAIEGKTDREELVNLIQAADKDKLSRMSRNDTEEISESERTRQDEVYKKSRNNFRQNIFQLKNSVGDQLPRGKDYLDYLMHEESTLTCDYHKVIELFQGSAAEKLEAISLYEQGQFLDDFETRYPKRHLAVAKELKLWVNDKRNDLLSLYLKAKPQHNTKTLTLKDLEKQLPKNAGGAALSISADTILNLASASYDSKEKQSCLNYLEDYIPIHIADVVEEEANRELTFKVLEVLCLVEPPDILLAQNCFSINDDALIGMVDDLQEDGWLDNEASSTKISRELLGKTLVTNRLYRSYSEHFDLVITLCKHASCLQKNQLLKNFIAQHVIQEDNYTVITTLVNQTCHQLINEQIATEAINLSTALIESYTKNKQEYPHELGFWYAYALERNRDHETANDILENLLKKVDSDNEKELYNKLTALRASVLSRISRTETDTSEAKSLADSVLKGDYEWAMAEAHNTLGRISFNLDEDLFRTKSHFNRSALLWESQGETLRQLGAMINLAAIIDRKSLAEETEETTDRKSLIKEAEEAYENAFELAIEKEVDGDVWIGLLQNRIMFYHDNYIEGLVPNKQLYAQRASDGIKELKRAIKIEKLTSYTESFIYRNIATYHREVNKRSPALEYYEKMLEVSKEAKMINNEGLALVWIGLLTEDFDKVELGIDFLTKGGFEEDAQHSIREYKSFLKEKLKDLNITKSTQKEILHRLEIFK